MSLTRPAGSKLGAWRRPEDRRGLSAAALVRTACAAGVAVTGSMVSAPSATAAGFWIYEMGAPDLGTASAGRAGSAKDAATVFGNPAGMTSLDRSQLLVGTEMIVGDVHFDRGGDTTVAGGSGGNASGTLPGASFFYAHSVTPDFKLGFWNGSYFGGALDYEDNSSGRYYVQKVELLTLGAGINGAYKINDWLSIGGGRSLFRTGPGRRLPMMVPLSRGLR